MSDDDDVLATALNWRNQGQDVALATVVGTWGSSPRPVGSLLAVTKDQQFVGSVSGGCVEGAVIEQAGRVMRTGIPILADFGITDDEAWAVGLACGGKLEVLIERAPDLMGLNLLAKVRPVIRVVRIDDGAWTVISDTEALGPLKLGAESLRRARALAASGGSGLDDLSEGRVFVQTLQAPLRMVIVGAVHIAQVLARMAALAGFAVIVVDPRRAFATEARFPGVNLSWEWPDDAVRTIAPDRRTAVVTLTHDPKLDDPALILALASNAYYIGALGSRKTHEKRCARLVAAGVTEPALGRIHSPVGLPLGGRKASEIAVSILAEAVQELYAAPPKTKVE